MTRACMGALVALALAAGLALRLTRLDARPMHHDEANQALKFGALLERGEYAYDAHDHHGPTLYYLSLPAAKLRGQTTLASLDERTLRGVTATFGAATILLLPLLSAGIGRTAAAASAWLLALSPAMVFYSRMFIQESLLAFFTLAFVIAVGRAATGGGLGVVYRCGRRGRPGDRDQGNLGHRIARRARRLRDRLVVAGNGTPAESVGWPAIGDAVSGRHRGGGGRRRALLFVVSHRAASRPRSVSGSRPVPRSRHRPGEPRAPVELLPRAAHVLFVRRPEVERGARARAGDRRRGDGCTVVVRPFRVVSP